MRSQTTMYDTLGVERDASDQDIRQAFRRLALKHHPDRFSGEDRGPAEERFQIITEAFNVLRDPTRREEYDKTISKGGDATQMDASEISRRLAAKGSQELREGKIAAALDNLKMAIDHDDNNARAHYFFSKALAKVTGKERDALRHAEKAMSLESGNATIIAEAAVLALSAGMKSRAVRYANQALALDPTNSTATNVISLAEGGEADTSGSLLSRLRGKS